MWTIDDDDEMDRLLDLGVDGIMTDRPAVLQDVLERRGQWVVLAEPVPDGAAAHPARLPRSAPAASSPTGSGRRSTGERARFTYADVRRALRPAGAGAAATTSACGPATASRGCAATRHELLEAYYGVLLAGAVLLPLNIRLAAAELRGHARRQRAPSVLFRASRPSPTPTTRCAQIMLGDEYEALLAAQPDSCRSAPRRRRARRAELFYTSGSTGTPKGALLTHRGLYLHAIHSALTDGITGDDVVLHTIPLFHVNGWGTPHYVTGLGGVHVMLPRFDAAEVLRLVEAERVTRLFLVPDDGDARCSTIPTLDDAATCRACSRSRSAARRRRRRCSPRSSAGSGASASAATG